MKNNRGIAMVYTVVTMLIVFAICMLIITVILAQITYSKKYTERFETERISSQIGDIFYISSGENTSGEVPKTDSSFAKALVEAGFEIVNDDNPEWQVSYGKYKVTLKFETYEKDHSLTIINIDSRRVMLRVTLRIDGDIKEIIDWTTEGN